MKKLLAAGAIALAALAIPAFAKEEAKKPAAAPAAAAAPAPKVEALMDINTASEKELATLKGVGDVRAKAIVKGRPYKGKNELVDKKIVPESVYNDIKDKIIAKQAEAKPAEGKKKKGGC